MSHRKFERKFPRAIHAPFCSGAIERGGGGRSSGVLLPPWGARAPRAGSLAPIGAG